MFTFNCSANISHKVWSTSRPLSSPTPRLPFAEPDWVLLKCFLPPKTSPILPTLPIQVLFILHSFAPNPHCTQLPMPTQGSQLGTILSPHRGHSFMSVDILGSHNQVILLAFRGQWPETLLNIPRCPQQSQQHQG